LPPWPDINTELVCQHGSLILTSGGQVRNLFYVLPSFSCL
jgi:hypothetical protein